MNLTKKTNRYCRIKFVFNDEKIKIILFLYRNTTHLPPISIGNSVIERNTSLNCVGIMVEEHLNSKNHVHYISNELSRSIGILNKIK